jgi:hypothetical protein
VDASVVDPNPNTAKSEIICKLGFGSESVINFGSVSKFPTNKYKAVKMYRLSAVRIWVKNRKNKVNSNVL